jgi:hypothetical protein
MLALPRPLRGLKVFAMGGPNIPWRSLLPSEDHRERWHVQPRCDEERSAGQRRLPLRLEKSRPTKCGVGARCSSKGGARGARVAAPAIVLGSGSLRACPAAD